jgi:hypothetical protein
MRCDGLRLAQTRDRINRVLVTTGFERHIEFYRCYVMNVLTGKINESCLPILLHLDYLDLENEGYGYEYSPPSNFSLDQKRAVIVFPPNTLPSSAFTALSALS